MRKRYWPVWLLFGFALYFAHDLFSSTFLFHRIHATIQGNKYYQQRRSYVVPLLNGKHIKLKIYDDLLPEANTQVLEMVPGLNSPTHEHSTDIVLHHKLLKINQWHLFNNTVVLSLTNNSNEAALFYIPAYLTNILKLKNPKNTEKFLYSRSQSAHIIHKILSDVISRHSAEWNRCNGCNHGISFSSGSGEMLIGNQNRDLLDMCTRFVVDGGVAAVSENRDIMIPYIIPPYLSCSNWTEDDFRPLKIHFRGKTDGKYLRTKMFKKLDKYYSEELGMKEIAIYDTKIQADRYWAEMRQSDFCLVPRGITPNSRHFVESVISGCIPVVISDPWKPYYPHLFDPQTSSVVLSSNESGHWEPLQHVNSEAFFIRIPESSLENVLPMLLAVENSVKKSLRRRLKQVCIHFSWPDPSQERDTIHSLLELWILQSYAVGNDWVVSLAND